MKNKFTIKVLINRFLIGFLLMTFSINGIAQGSCASPDGSFFNPNGLYPVSYTTAQDSNWCHSIPIPSSTPTTVCYQFRYPATGNIQMSFLVTTSGCTAGNCGQNYYINQSNPSNCGSGTFCSGSAVSNFRIYNPDCTLFGTNTKIGCGMIRDSVYTLCIDINPTGCTSINICPIVNCPSANCTPTPPCPMPNPTITGVNSICSGSSTTLTASGGNSYVWSTGDTTSTISVSPISSTTYTVTATNACGSKTFVKSITVNPTPVADFTISPADVIEPNTVISFTDISTNPGDPSWNFGDPLSGVSDTSTLLFPTHAYTDEGDYCATLISRTISGCADTVTKCITVIGNPIINIPNVFTPNNDDNNDWFYFETKGIKELTCTIYDRWGIKMREWNGVSEGWDGRTTSGNKAPDGVYYYIMTAVPAYEKAEIINKQGFLHLLKDK